jgi:hypothetical protein
MKLTSKYHQIFLIRLQSFENFFEIFEIDLYFNIKKLIKIYRILWFKLFLIEIFYTHWNLKIRIFSFDPYTQVNFSLFHFMYIFMSEIRFKSQN